MEKASTSLSCSHAGFEHCTVHSWILKPGRSVAYKFDLLPAFRRHDQVPVQGECALSGASFSIMSSDLDLFAASWLGAQAEQATLYCIRNCSLDI